MLWFKGRVIRTTDEHPFRVDGKGFTAAGELKAGDQLLGADKSKLPVENVVETGDTETVYNFCVADWHTYFVGKEDWDFEVWVHNACGAGGANGPISQGQNGKPAGSYRPPTKLPQTPDGVPIPSSPYPHTQIGTTTGRKGQYTAAREFGPDGVPIRDIHFTDHGRPNVPGHTIPHQHTFGPNPTGGTQIRGNAEPFIP
jgi:hypothetical protein